MTLFRPSFVRLLASGLLTLAVFGGLRMPRAISAEWPPLGEVAAKLRAEMPDLPEPTSAQTNVEAYLHALAPRVLRMPVAGEPAPLLPKARVYDHGAGMAYVRVGTVGTGLRSSIEKALEDLIRTNTLVGTVLDLRFAEGADYEAAMDAAGLFASTNKSEVKLGNRTFAIGGEVRGRSMPVMVLVNRETRGAAEALAAAVRATAGVCLLVGTNTSGQAREYRPVKINPEFSVQLAGAALQLPGGEPMPLGGLKPDLEVAVSIVDERAYWTNEFQRFVEGRPAGRSLTFRLNEAELVRRRQSRDFQDEPGRSGRGGRGSGPRRPNRLRPEPEPVPDSAPVVQDPALARALDLLSGVAMIPAEPVSPAGGDSL
jgi:hypothetical protein